MGRFLGQSQFKQIITAGSQVYDVTSNTTLFVNSVYFVNTTSAAITLTLPQLALAGEFVDIFDVAGKFGTNNCIVLPSGDGSTVGGFADNLTLNLDRVNIRLQFSSGLNNWVVTQLI
jgi:hypothetical protein